MGVIGLVWMGLVGDGDVINRNCREYRRYYIGGGMGWKLRYMKNACGVDGIDSEFFKSDLLKNIKTTPPYVIFEDKKIK